MPTVYVTVPREEAPKLAETLVEERLAACVNRIDCESTYRWEDGVEEDPEAILLVKTTADGYGALRERIADLHPYDVPCIERFDESDEFDRFAAWKADAVR
jgi:periplasmic divalent cation tolerance protein